MRTTIHLAVAFLAIVSLGCERDTSGLQPFPADTNPVVFVDGFEAGVDFQAFLNSKLDALQLETNLDHVFRGSASLRVTVPGPNVTTGFFAGGAMTTGIARDFSGYDALTFWAKASKTATLNIAGIGNDNTGTSRYEASLGDIPLTTDWTKHSIPIPLPAKLTNERGLFFFAEGHENNMGYDIWFDEIKYEQLGTVRNPRPELVGPSMVASFVGATVELETRVTFDVGSETLLINHLPGYFTFFSSADSVVQFTNERLRVVGPGSAVITAKLGDVDATGEATINVIDAPTQAAPTPTFPAGDVISIFSNAYANVIVDSWLAFGTANLIDFQIAGNDVKAYSDLLFAGIEFYRSQQVDVSAMTHFHIDVWVPSGTSLFRVKLVDFGADGVFGSDDSEHELTFNASSTPPLQTGTWVALDIPLSDFVRLTGLEHLSQLIISGTRNTVFVDNIYFHR